MSVEHRRQLLAFFIVALAAVLLIGNGLQSDLGRTNDPARKPAVVAAGPTSSTGQSSIAPGGSARGTTAVPPATSAPTPVTPTSVTSATQRAATGHSVPARNADRADQTSMSSAQKLATKRSARPASDDRVTISARSAGDGKKANAKKANAKKHGKKHGKRHGKKANKRHHHGH